MSIEPLIYLQILIFGVVAFLIWFFRTKQREKRRNILEEVAIRRGGRVDVGNFFVLPKLVLQHRAGEVTVSTRPRAKNSPPMTRVETKLNDSGGFQLAVYKEDPLQKALKLFGFEDIQIGDDTFDGAFVIKATDRAEAMRVLDGKVREKLLQLTRKGFRMAIAKDKFELVVNYIPSDSSEYEPILDGATAVLDQLQPSRF